MPTHTMLFAILNSDNRPPCVAVMMVILTYGTELAYTKTLVGAHFQSKFKM